MKAFSLSMIAIFYALAIGFFGPTVSIASTPLDHPIPEEVFLENPEDSMYTWTLVKSPEEVQLETEGINFIPRPFAFNRMSGDVYLVNSAAQKLFRYNIAENQISEIPADGWFGNAYEWVYNPSDNMLYAWRAGLDNVYRIPVSGGTWEHVVSGGFDAYRYGANTYFNGVSEQCGVVHGYGWYQYRRDANEMANGQWNQVIPNTSGVQPYKRSTTVLPNADFTQLILIDGRGNTNGDQWQSNCDIPGGLNWASDIGKWCWLRDIWKLDLATMTYTNVLPLNSNFDYTGVFGYDYTRDEYYRFGGYVPAAVYGQEQPTTNATAKLNFAGDPSWDELSVQGDMPPENAGGISFFIESLDLFMIFNSHGIWSFEFPDGLPPVVGCSDPEACNYSADVTLDDGTCQFGCEFCGLGTTWDTETQSCIPSIGPYLNAPDETAELNPCYFDTNYDGLVEVTDLMNLLSVYNMSCFWQCGDRMSYQGYDYETVMIGEQCWFAENLSYIPEGEVALTEGNVSTPAAYSSADVDDTQIYYNHYAAVEWDMCPSGWHVPTLLEWDELNATLASSEMSALDAEGLHVLLAGYWDSGVLQAGAQATLWSVDIHPDNGWGLFQNFTNSGSEYSGSSGRDSGASLRCVQDE